MIKNITYICTVLPTFIWFLIGYYQDSINLSDNVLVLIFLMMALIAIIGIITSIIMLKIKYKHIFVLCLIYNFIIVYVLIFGLIYSGGIKI